MFVFAQVAPDVAPPVMDLGKDPTFWQMMMLWVLGWQGWLVFAFVLWMVVSCVQRDPEWHIWLWIILIFPGFGATIYFFARYLPSQHVESPRFLQRWTRRGELRRLEVAAAQIGNAHQYVQWGDALRELGRIDDARQAYGKALAKEPENMPALWGSALVEYQLLDHKSAQVKLARLLEVDPNYKFGDVSLLFGKVLVELNEIPSAQVHLQEHVCKWRQPEGIYLLAKVCLQQQDYVNARNWLEELIVDVDSSPPAIARKQMTWKRRAQRLLRRLPK